MTEKEKIKAVLRALKYALFIGFMGCLTEFALPPEKNVWIRISLGCVLGMMMLGRKLPEAIKDYLRAMTNGIFD